MVRSTFIIRSGRIAVVVGGVLSTALCAGSVSLATQSSVNLQPGFPLNAGSGFQASPAIADVDGDGLADLVAADVNGNVHVWRHDGTYLPGWPRCAGRSCP